MIKKGWLDDQVLAYLEYKIQEDIASDEEISFYSECEIEGKLIHSNFSRKLIKEMNSIGGY